MADRHVLVVGGGTAGSVLAARLSADPATRVTLLDGEPFGFTVDVRKGPHVFNVMITGVDIELDELDEVLCAVLERSVRLARGLVH